MQDLRTQQLKYEIDSDVQAQAATLQNLVLESLDGDLELPRAQALIGRMCAEVMKHLQAAADAHTPGAGGKWRSWLRALPTDVAAVLAIRECIRACSTPDGAARIQDLAYRVGSLWELEVRVRQAESVNPLYMQKIYTQIKDRGTVSQSHLRKVYGVAVERVFKGEVDFSLSRADIVNIGKVGVAACYEAGLLDMQRSTDHRGDSVWYTLPDEVWDFLTGYTNADVDTVLAKHDSRMMCPPDPWTNAADGGYISPRRKILAPLLPIRKIRKSVRQTVAEAFTAENMPQVFEAGNYLQSIPYDVHLPTRDAILRVWEAGGGVMGVPTREMPTKPVFPFPDTWAQEDAQPGELAMFQGWKRRMVDHYEGLREWRGRVRELSTFMRTSGKLDGPFWFPVYMDTRGRWYYRGMPNPQGSDIARSTLHFHEKRPLGKRGVFWLKVAIANHFGFDKERFEDRARWTEKHWDRIAGALDRPEDHESVWGTDAPWGMFTAAWELREALRTGSPETYCTGVPVHMDATCSGLQHFSALLRDPVGGLYVNLTDPNQCGPKQDVYGEAARNTLRIIELDTQGADPAKKALAEWVLQVGIPRNLAKKPVMTYVYGATVNATAHHIEGVLSREVLPAKGMQWLDETQIAAHCRYIAVKLFQGIAATVPAAAAAMKWLRTVARQQPNGRRMQWRTPTGFLVQHDYRGTTTKRVELKSCGIYHTVVQEWTEDTKSVAMQNAISPNFVHALDASHLTLTALELQKHGACMTGIHDSFGTHPCDVDTMHEAIRSTFVKMYSSGNLLAEFLWDVQGVGEVPSRGTLELSEVLSSEFMFS
jgi:DNA-directed RNA polymerase